MRDKLLDEAVHTFRGLWPNDMMIEEKKNRNGFFYLVAQGKLLYHTLYDYGFNDAEFKSRAKELGHINGYRWGVEYLTNGKKPDLMEDVLIDAKCEKGTNEWLGWTDMEVSDAAWSDRVNAVPVSSFKIIDPRYKPKDTSYLDKPTVVGVDMASGKGETIECVVRTKIELEVVNSEDWYDYENQKALRLPPVGVECESFWPLDSEPFWHQAMVMYVSDINVVLKFKNGAENCYKRQALGSEAVLFRPLDWNRKAEAERKRVVDAAYNAISKPMGIGVDEALSELYDLGYLRIPKDSNN